jgi:hypothetical protein
MFETSSKKLGLDQAVLHSGGLSGKKANEDKYVFEDCLLFI